MHGCLTPVQSCSILVPLQECEALGVSPPAFPQLDEVSADLAAMPVAF
jgi:hypothetical protein